MSKLGSPTYQVTQVLNQVFTPGRSRHAAKQLGQTDGHIYSIGTMRTYVEDAARFARWCRDVHDVRDIGEITAEMANAYLDHLAGRERSGGYIGRVRSAILKLSHALHGKRWNLGAGWHSDRRPERVYTDDQVAEIVADLQAHARDPQVAHVVRLQHIAGLRRREAVRLRGQDIDSERCLIHLERGTKGGRPRQVQVDAGHQAYLRELEARATQHRDGHVFQGRGSLGRRVERAVDEACRRLGIPDQGTHGFRKAFAAGRYEQLRAEGLGDVQARRELTGDLGHGRVQVTYSYVPRKP